MKWKCVFVLVAFLAAGCVSKSDVPTYLDTKADIEERVADALSRMSVEEKVKILHAQSKFSSAGVPRLGIPELWCTDGPHGIRPEVLWDEWSQAGWTNDSCTSFPALTCLAATWNREMSLLYGRSIGEEARYREKDVLLGPGVNIYRTPLCGRNFEYMGEDPLLAAEMVVPYVKGVQENGVAACVKHFALNNQQEDRLTINVEVDDRALYEIYLPAFEAAVKDGGAWAIMGAYNKYKNQHCCHNQYLLDDILKGEWGFDGAVISDWGGVHSTESSARRGIDLEFGTFTDGLDTDTSDGYDNYFLAMPYLELLKKSNDPELMKKLDDKASRVLRLILRTAMNAEKPFGSLNSPEHHLAARKIAGEGMVLLKNQMRTLPIDLDKCKRILVVGENAIKKMSVGGGSSSLKTQHEVSPLEGLKNAVGDKAEIVYERGYVGDVITTWKGVSTGQDLTDNRSKEELLAAAVEQAKKADVVLFIGGLNKSKHQDSESADRLQYGLPYAQDEVIEALAEVNQNLAVILVSGNGVAMPWVERVPTILQAWFAGSEAGNALADVVFGEVNPSGKLPFTMPVRLEDNAAHALDAYTTGKSTTYKEGLFVGYRWHDAQDIKPLFAFGHGLSYTTFELSNIEANRTTLSRNGKITVSVDVTNTGDRAGAEVVQLYIGDVESSLPRPAKELKGFEKVFLGVGETRTVKFDITADDLKFFDDAKHEWVAESGDFTAHIGTASDRIESVIDFKLR